MVSVDPIGLSAIFARAQACLSKGDLAEAERLCKDILRLSPDDFPATYLLGIIAVSAKRHPEASNFFSRAALLKPSEPSTHNNLGNVLLEMGKLDDALSSFDSALRLRPSYAEAQFNRGNALRGLRRIPEALAAYDSALRIKPDLPEALNNRGKILRELKRLDEAEQSFARAVQLAPGNAHALTNLGVVVGELDRLEEALALHDKALALSPNSATVLINRGLALQHLKRFEEALASYDRALQIAPDSAAAYSNRGLTLHKLRQLDGAEASFEKALSIDAGLEQAWYNRGVLLAELERPAEAEVSFKRALELKPDYAVAHRNRGELHWHHGRYQDALESYEKALVASPDLPWMYGTWLHARMNVCDWREWRTHTSRILELTKKDRRSAQPFCLLPFVDSPELHSKVTVEFAREISPPPSNPLPVLSSARKDRIHIGYYSADFREHPVAHLTARIFETHDRSRFEVSAFSFGPEVEDAMRSRLRTAFDHFHDVRRESDRDLAVLSRRVGVDIAVDLTGYTAHNRARVFAYRAAPVQINYLGYPGSMAAPYMDYIVADRIIIPREARSHYTEKVVYLPDSYQVNETGRMSRSRTYTRAELGLPDRGMVFCCFNSGFKITPEMFAAWLRILKAVPESVLWLAKSNELIISNLRQTAELDGVQSDRLVFAGRVPSITDHLARYRMADLFLDTFPYNAHTTASDALGAGLPVLTRAGQSFASRVAGSLLHSVGLGELVTVSSDDYERVAIELAHAPWKLQMLRQRLDDGRTVSPLFDVERFTGNLEKAYIAMHERSVDGLPPADIAIG